MEQTCRQTDRSPARIRPELSGASHVPFGGLQIGPNKDPQRGFTFERSVPAAGGGGVGAGKGLAGNRPVLKLHVNDGLFLRSVPHLHHRRQTARASPEPPSPRFRRFNRTLLSVTPRPPPQFHTEPASSQCLVAFERPDLQAGSLHNLAYLASSICVLSAPQITSCRNSDFTQTSRLQTQARFISRSSHTDAQVPSLRPDS